MHKIKYNTKKNLIQLPKIKTNQAARTNISSGIGFLLNPRTPPLSCTSKKSRLLLDDESEQQGTGTGTDTGAGTDATSHDLPNPVRNLVSSSSTLGKNESCGRITKPSPFKAPPPAP